MRVLQFGWVAVFFTLTSCSWVQKNQPTTSIDADADDGLGGTGIESGDIRSAADQISRALLVDAGAARTTDQQRVVVLPVKNESRFRIDPALLQNQLVNDLVKHAKGRFTVLTVRPDATTRSTGETFLRTEVRSLTKHAEDAESDYVQYAFTLERAADGAVLWTGMYDTKRIDSVDVVYQ
jgi:hypothetical protein